MSNEPNILVERHYIPLSVYLQIYNPTQSTPTISAPRSMANQVISDLMRDTSQTGQSTTSQQQQSFPSSSRYGADTRHSRRTSNTNPNNTNTTTNNERPFSSAYSFLNNNRNSVGNGYRFETVSNENDFSLFSSLFAALVNPTTRTSSSNQGLTMEQIITHTSCINYLSANPALTSNSCSICTMEYETDDSLRKLNKCGHYFHTRCIDRWLDEHNTCPLCRTNIIQDDANTTSQNSGTSTSSNATATPNSNTTNSNTENMASYILRTRVFDINGVD